MNLDSKFQPPPLKARQVQVWVVDLGGSDLDASKWECLLSAAEIERSKHFKFAQDRSRFIARRGILRQLLGHYCHLDPAGLTYHVSRFGKLSLPGQPVSFNLSHSQDWAAFAFTSSGEVGVDIERVHSLPDLSRLVEHWFSRDEQEGMSALDEPEKLASFFHVWTQKEAFLKAHGAGLSFPTRDFSVSTDPGKPGRLLAVKGSQAEASRWKMNCEASNPELRAAACVHMSTEPDFLWYQPDPVQFIADLTS